MGIEEITKSIYTHLVEGMMLHEQMANYFDFLGLMGFKRIHEYEYLCDSVSLRGVSRYYINHYNKLIKSGVARDPDLIPSVWYGYTRQDVNTSAREAAVKTAIIKWRDWEHDTKKLYEQAYHDACELGEVALACKIKEMVCEVDKELKCADRLYIKLDGVGYESATMFLMQDDLHKKYKHKSKEIGVNIC